jgi:nicotinate dehydrogenase subunit A
MSISFTLNGKTTSLDIDPDTPLLEALRNDLELNGPKFGCGLAQCGACSVLLNGQAIRSCVTPISTVSGLNVVTLEGLGNAQHPHPLQTAFIEEQALQCGYCSNGMIINAAALLARNSTPDKKDIDTALADILCRCGAHPRIVRAIKRAAEIINKADS